MIKTKKVKTEKAETQKTRTGQIKIVVFDCDGVMFDTENSNKIYYNTLLKHFNKPELSHEQFEYVHMSTVGEAIPYLFADTDLTDAALEYASNFSYAPLIKHMIIEPYLKTILKKLKKSFTTAIATNRSTTMNGVLREHNLEDEFNMVVTSMDVENPKPHPEQLYKIINFFKVTPEELLYIGDSRTDEQAAKASGVIFVAYKNKLLSADFYISSLTELEEILNIH